MKEKEQKEVLRAAVEEILNNQLRDNKPAETKITLERLMAAGNTEHNARLHISQCIVVELFDILKHKKPFDEARYVQNLKNLPKKPF